MSVVDKVSIHGQIYHILSPSIVGNYVETIGEGCQNPSGYSNGAVFLGYDNDVQYLYKATANITYSETITEGVNCDNKTLYQILGNGIASIAKTSTVGLVDTYTITFTDGTTTTFTVTNGADSTGDMAAADYDSDNSVKAAGGIAAYVEDQIETLDVSDSVVSGSYVTGVSETNGKIAVTREAADGTPTDSSTKLVTSGGVKTAIDTLSGKAYQTDDTTETALASDDLLPFYDTSATAKKKMTVANVVEQTVSNPNLLDNPWFTVNQRGITSWSNESAGYSADRWSHDGSATGDITNGVYTCNTPTYQNWEDDRITPLLGKTVTLSWMLSDGSIGFETKTLPSALTSEFVFPFTNNYVVLALKSGDVSQATRINADVAVKAVKLELGTVSTLAMDTAPNYQQELAKCQRYFLKIGFSDDYAMVGVGQAREAAGATILVPTPVTMRAKPSISYSGLILLRNKTDISASTVFYIDAYSSNSIMLIANSANLTPGACYECFAAPNGFLYFSADL